MINPRIIPVLLLKGSGLVKTANFKNPVYIGDPVNAVKIFNDKEVDELIFLDIEASRNGSGVDYAAISRIAGECFMPLCYGGGVASVAQMKKIFSLGFEKISINSSALANPPFIKEAASFFGRQSIIVAMDVKKGFLGKYQVIAKGGSQKTGRDAVVWAKEAESLGAGEILLNSIDRDGTMQGYDDGLVAMVSRAVNIPVIACGGAGKIEDFAAAVAAGASAAAAGSLFVFYGKNRAVLINYPSRSQIESIAK